MKKQTDMKEHGNKILLVFVDETKTFICNNLITAIRRTTPTVNVETEKEHYRNTRF